MFSKKRKFKDVKGISFLLNNVKGFLGTVHIDPCLCAQNEPRGSAPGADRKAAAANAKRADSLQERPHSLALASPPRVCRGRQPPSLGLAPGRGTSSDSDESHARSPGGAALFARAVILGCSVPIAHHAASPPLLPAVRRAVTFRPRLALDMGETQKLNPDGTSGDSPHIVHFPPSRAAACDHLATQPGQPPPWTLLVPNERESSGRWPTPRAR